MTIAVDMGRKATKATKTNKTKQQLNQMQKNSSKMDLTPPVILITVRLRR